MNVITVNDSGWSVLVKSEEAVEMVHHYREIITGSGNQDSSLERTLLQKRIVIGHSIGRYNSERQWLVTTGKVRKGSGNGRPLPRNL